MNNLNKLKLLVKQSTQVPELSDLEQIVLDYLTPEISLQALEAVKDISRADLQMGIEEFSDESTKKLWLSVLNWQNFSLFLNQADHLYDDEVKEWSVQQGPMQVIGGEFNVQKLSFKLSDSTLHNLFSKLNFNFNLSEVLAFAEQLKFLDETLDQYFPAKLVWQAGEYKLLVGQESKVSSQTSRVNWWQEHLAKPIQAVSICIVLFSSVNALAQSSDVSSAVEHAKQAALQQPGIKEKVQDMSKKVENLGKDLANQVKDTPAEIPVTIVGYGVKAAVDQKIEVKGKNVEIKSLGVAVDYNLAVGFDSSVQMGIGGKNPLMDQGTYKLQGVKNHQEEKIELNLNFEF